MEEPGGRFASGLFRRTGGAGSATARGGDRKVSGGLDPIPIQRRAAWATRLARVRGEPARPGLLPHCDASRARPSKKRPSRYSRAYGRRQEQSENITLPATFLSPSHVITGLVPVISIACGAALFRIGMAGTRPAMTCGGAWETVSFPAGAKRRGRETRSESVGVDPLPGLSAAGDDTQHVVGAGWPDDA